MISLHVYEKCINTDKYGILQVKYQLSAHDLEIGEFPDCSDCFLSVPVYQQAQSLILTEFSLYPVIFILHYGHNYG